MSHEETDDSKQESISMEEDEEPISLEDTSQQGGQSANVRTFGAAAANQAIGEKQFNRELNITGQGATRCRVFHSKISTAALEMMQRQINEWLDGDEIEVKQVCQTVGAMQGKTSENNLIVTVWY